jgi:hypothetical protein
MKIKDNTTILDTDFENILKIMQEFVNASITLFDL